MIRTLLYDTAVTAVLVAQRWARRLAPQDGRDGHHPDSFSLSSGQIARPSPLKSCGLLQEQRLDRSARASAIYYIVYYTCLSYMSVAHACGGQQETTVDRVSSMTRNGVAGSHTTSTSDMYDRPHSTHHTHPARCVPPSARCPTTKTIRTLL